MALIVENGTGVANANSYISVSSARVWAASRGASLPAVDTDAEVALIKAMDFIEALRTRFSGVKTLATQSLQWPRSGASVDGSELEADAIPAELLSAQVQLAIDAATVDLQPTGTGQEVLREKIDVIEVQYAERGSGTVQPQLNKAMAFLEPLFKNGGFSTLRTVRV